MPDKITIIKKIKCKNTGIETMCRMLENQTTPKIQCDLTKTENSKIVGSCAFGEIGLQLHMTDLNIFMIINKLVKLGIPKQLIDRRLGNADLLNSILRWNDKTRLSKPQIAQKIRKKFGDVEQCVVNQR